ncbi:hypothetical protein [Chitinophaga polysaccharea]|uniref:hypothetical protein n=1 Tax=Chitinophaga polysaccharea TaxID=1293035 RepID=UPI001158C2C4|nr:hypothetical protein [Chitinophaga polysaccharea]
MKANLSLLGVNANYELRLLKYSTLNLEAGVEMGLSYSNSSYFGEDWEFAAYPVFSAEFRQYYGIARRAEKNKRIDNNAGNFFSLTGGYIGEPLTSTKYSTGSVFITPAWGMQRSWGRRFSFEGRFGLTFFPKEYADVVQPSIRINFGYIIL